MERWDKYAGTSKDLTWNFLEEMNLWAEFFLCVWAHFFLFPSQLLFLSPFAPCFLSSISSQNWEQPESRAGFFLVRSDSSVDDTPSCHWRQWAFPGSTFLAHTFIFHFSSILPTPPAMQPQLSMLLLRYARHVPDSVSALPVFSTLNVLFYSNGFFIWCLLWLRNLDLQWPRIWFCLGLRIPGTQDSVLKPSQSQEN